MSTVGRIEDDLRIALRSNVCLFRKRSKKRLRCLNQRTVKPFPASRASHFTLFPWNRFLAECTC